MKKFNALDFKLYLTKSYELIHMTLTIKNDQKISCNISPANEQYAHLFIYPNQLSFICKKSSLCWIILIALKLEMHTKDHSLVGVTKNRIYFGRILFALSKSAGQKMLVDELRGVLGTDPCGTTRIDVTSEL